MGQEESHAPRNGKAARIKSRASRKHWIWWAGGLCFLSLCASLCVGLLSRTDVYPFTLAPFVLKDLLFTFLFLFLGHGLQEDGQPSCCRLRTMKHYVAVNGLLLRLLASQVSAKQDFCRREGFRV